MKSENLRRELRVDARIEVCLVRGRRLERLETRDVSYKGLFLETTSAPAIRSLVRLKVRLPLREIDAHAMAVHIVAPGDGDPNARTPGVGVQFWGLSGPDRIAWDDFVRELILVEKVKRPPPLPAPPEPMPWSEKPTPSGIRIVSSAELEDAVDVDKASSHDIG